MEARCQRLREVTVKNLHPIPNPGISLGDVRFDRIALLAMGGTSRIGQARCAFSLWRNEGVELEPDALAPMGSFCCTFEESGIIAPKWGLFSAMYSGLPNLEAKGSFKAMTLFRDGQRLGTVDSPNADHYDITLTSGATIPCSSERLNLTVGGSVNVTMGEQWKVVGLVESLRRLFGTLRQYWTRTPWYQMDPGKRLHYCRLWDRYPSEVERASCEERLAILLLSLIQIARHGVIGIVLSG